MGPEIALFVMEPTSESRNYVRGNNYDLVQPSNRPHNYRSGCASRCYGFRHSSLRGLKR
jgi:hypothetical protein